MTEEIRNHTGLVGYLTDIEYVSKDSILVFQVPRSSAQISQNYAEEIRKNIKKIAPPGRDVLIIPGDMDVFEIMGEDALVLKLKGIF